MVIDLLIALAGVMILSGVGLGEVFDVWYDMTHAEQVEGAETISLVPRKPLAFGYAKDYFREVLATPDAFEHYHWGIWLATNALTAVLVVPWLGFFMIGIGISLILDENRRGLADRPFGFGKPYFGTSALIGALLVGLLIIRILAISTPFEAYVAFLCPAFPIAVFVVLWIAERIHR